MPATVLALFILATLVARPAAALTQLQYTPLGCFADQGVQKSGNGARTMTQIASSVPMTVNLCANLAQGKGYTIFGLQVGLQGQDSRGTACCRGGEV